MQIRNVRHRALVRFLRTGNSAGLPASQVEKLRTMLTFWKAWQPRTSCKTFLYGGLIGSSVTALECGPYMSRKTGASRSVSRVTKSSISTSKISIEDGSTVQSTRMKEPAHPGSFVREIVAELDLSITSAAQALDVTRPALSAVLNERASLSPEMALRIEKAFGVRMDTLLRMQVAFDVARARSREREIDVKRVVRKARSAAPTSSSTQ